MALTEATSAEITAIGTVVLALATIALAIGVPWSLHVARIEARNRFYAELDRTYLELQKLIMQMPHFANPQLIQTLEEAIQYDAFAYGTWNFLEAIYDYSEQDESLLETWKCVFVYESHLHRAWFDKDENRVKFKNSFVKYVRERTSVESRAGCGVAIEATTYTWRRRRFRGARRER